MKGVKCMLMFTAVIVGKECKRTIPVLVTTRSIWDWRCSSGSNILNSKPKGILQNQAVRVILTQSNVPNSLSPCFVPLRHARPTPTQYP